MQSRLWSVLIWIISSLSVAYAEPNVMVTLKPLHALVSGVMDGVGQPHLLLTGQESPHTYTLKPSQVKLLAKMDLVVWLGPSVENFLEKPLTNLNEKVVILNLLQTPHLSLFKIRSGETWAQHSESAEGQSHHIHQAEQIDGHVWLSPDNAQVIVQAIARKLGEMDSAHAEIYQTNANRLIQRLKAFSQNLREELIVIKDQPYLVFHDAYQYFEKYYRLNAKGAITISPEVPLSPRRLSEIRQKIKQLKVVCVFSEPQFAPPVLATVIEGMSVKQGTLDPLGVDLPAGTESYFTLLQTLATHLTTCLTDQTAPSPTKRGIRG